MHAQQQILGYANDLLQLYAKRAVEGGFSYPPDSSLTEQFARDFPYVETSDQLLAIQAIREDMMSNQPMDRLICGDVGFGKTEVAIRGAFKAVTDGKQVAILVPTTLLAEQHFQNFSDRFAEFPIKIAELSRFRSAKEQTEALKGMAEGKIDIVIGTHKLIQKDIKFPISICR